MINERNILKFKTRQEIYDFINNNPGLHFRELSRRMNIPRTTFRHHLRYLKKMGLINEKKEGKYKRIYLSKKMSTQEKQILNLIRQEIPCKIFIYLLFSYAFSTVELSRELEIPRATALYHLKKLSDMGIIEEAEYSNGFVYPFRGVIERKAVGSEKFYRRKNAEITEIIYRLLVTYRYTLFDGDLIDYYIDYYRAVKGDSYPVGKSVESCFNSVIDWINEAFRPPFCA